VVERARREGMRLEVAHEEEPLGTAGALKNAEALVGDEAFFAFNGDILTTVDLEALVRFHRDNDAEATIMLTPVEDPSAFGVVPTDESGRVEGFIEKPPRDEAPTNMINAGVYVFEPSVLRRIPPGRSWSAERDLFPGLVAEGARMFAWSTDAYWLDIGTPQSYLRANLDALSGRYVSEAIGVSPTRGILLGDGARVAADARVSSSCLGEHSVVESNATVEDSVLLPGAVVGAGANVQGSILGEGATVRASVQLRDRTLADGEVVQGEVSL
ncbi:MAG TPA: NDP-sugar synthase, partial [Actinomycetota bacterium]|nr:NDP-sugar synthase [Actinomycetota bacterium]